MFDSLLPLLLMGAGIWVWLAALATRERVTRTVQELCAQSQVQLLDQTIALRGLSLRRVRGRWALRRRYGFEVSVHGDDRHRGHVVLLGDVVDNWSMPTPQPPTTIVPISGTVESLRTLH
ncbi:MAG: DUF3301 domain-containing protein [Dokdonella sp.]